MKLIARRNPSPPVHSAADHIIPRARRRTAGSVPHAWQERRDPSVSAYGGAESGSRWSVLLWRLFMSQGAGHPLTAVDVLARPMPGIVIFPTQIARRANRRNRSRRTDALRFAQREASTAACNLIEFSLALVADARALRAPANFSTSQNTHMGGRTSRS